MNAHPVDMPRQTSDLGLLPSAKLDLDFAAREPGWALVAFIEDAGPYQAI
jgi:hypothetical protein